MRQHEFIIYLFRINSLVCNIQACCTRNITEVQLFTFDSVMYVGSDFHFDIQTRETLLS